MGKKSKSVSYMRDKSTLVWQDSPYFDFIPFAFSKTRSAFFVNNNFTIEQLVKTNKKELLNNDVSLRSQLFFKIKDASEFIDYDVEVIRTVREKDYFETIFVRKHAINILSQINENVVKVLARACNAKRSENSQDIWLDIEGVVIDHILNGLKLDDLIERLFKASNDHRFLISHLIGVNVLIYTGGDDKMTENQKRAYACAMEVKQALRGRENKLRAYEQRLISALTLKDYDRVQEVLLHLSAFTQVRMDFLIDVFKDFEANKNLVYTFINVLGEKRRVERKAE
jgi:CRISPR-associated protein Cst1